MGDNALKPAVLLWVLITDSFKMSQGVLPVTWYTSIQDIQDPSKFIQVVVPYDYFVKLYDVKDELEKATRDLML